MLQRHILLLVVLLGLSACGLAHASMVLTDASSGMPLNAHIELLEDTQGTLSIDNITAPRTAGTLSARQWPRQRWPKSEPLVGQTHPAA